MYRIIKQECKTINCTQCYYCYSL